ncbi:MAG: RluA family pseudouridine synthase [Kiritimatiellia bacterium]
MDPTPPSVETLVIGPVPTEEAGQRLDAWLARRHPALSRSRWQQLIKDGRVTIRLVTARASQTVMEGDIVHASLPAAIDTELQPEDIALDVIYEDHCMIVINKPPGLVVHPAPGHAGGTLVNALLHHCPDLEGIGGEKRPGIVHRLDRDTSGVMVMAKNEIAMLALARQFKDRSTRKEYVAVVWGTPVPASGTIKTTIGRDPVHRKKMSTRSKAGRDAVTHYRVLKIHGEVALIALRIETGRTHQIRVHMAHLKHPVVGDEVYGLKRPPVLPVEVSRQLLHAWKLTIAHPLTGEVMTFAAPWPEDLRATAGVAEDIVT